MSTEETTQQEARKKHLRNLVDIHHRGKCGDYEDNYATFEMTYFGTVDGEVPCPECEGTDAVKIFPNGTAKCEDCNNSFEVGKDTEPIPRYASIANDETYGMIHLVDTLDEALKHQAGIPENGEYLNVPAGIYDLDSEGNEPKRITVHTVMFTDDMLDTLKQMWDDADAYRLGEWSEEELEEDEDAMADQELRDQYQALMDTIK